MSPHYLVKLKIALKQMTSSVEIVLRNFREKLFNVSLFCLFLFVRKNSFSSFVAKKSGTHEDEKTVLFKTISLDGIKPNTNSLTI